MKKTFYKKEHIAVRFILKDGDKITEKEQVFSYFGGRADCAIIENQ